jgi:hypothetical protein
VDHSVDKVCRHAGKVVRRLGKWLWTSRSQGLDTPHLAGKTCSTGCAGEKVLDVFSVRNPQPESTPGRDKAVDNSCAKACADAPPAWYASTVYSTRELALKGVTEAIEELDAVRRSRGAGDLEAQVAAVWAMVRELDPELAKVASRY